MASDKQSVIRSLKEHTGGASVITTAQFARFLGVSHKRAKVKLSGLPAYEGKYFLTQDVADMILKSMS